MESSVRAGTLLLWHRLDGVVSAAEFRSEAAAHDAVAADYRAHARRLREADRDPLGGHGYGCESCRRQYGDVLELEEVGCGTVEGFADHVALSRAAADAELDREDAERAAAGEAAAAARAALGTGALFAVLLRPSARASESLCPRECAPCEVASGLPVGRAIAERDRLEALFGRERVSVCQTAWPRSEQSETEQSETGQSETEQSGAAE